MNKTLNKLPKVELHLHLDGSVPLELASSISNLNIEEIKDKMVAPTECRDLSDYLTKFDFPCSLMQDRESLKRIAYQLVEDLAKDNVIYAEVRFAPMFHLKGGLSYEEVIEAVIEGLRANKKVKTNLILCMMRGSKESDNLKTIEMALKYLNRGVVGIDLAGAEDKYPLDNYLYLFEIVKKYNIPFTIHAGENGNALEVKKAIEVGAKRIGHGIHAIDDNEVIELLKRNKVLLEICPTSNFQTDSVVSYETHPIKKLYDNNVLVSVNTDNRTVSNISLDEEYKKLTKYFNFSINDYKKMNLNAIDSAFVREEEKKILKNIIMEVKNEE